MCLVQCRCGVWTRTYARLIRTLWSHFTPADPEYKAKPEKVSESESEDEEPPQLALARRRAIAAPAVTPFGVLPDEYNVARLLVVRPGSGSAPGGVHTENPWEFKCRVFCID